MESYYIGAFTKSIADQDMMRKKFKTKVQEVLEEKKVWDRSLFNEIPQRWERHGDLIIVGSKYFQSDVWKELDVDTWNLISKWMYATRVAKCYGPIQNDGFRTPSVQFLHNPGDSLLVEKKENGIIYTWNATKCMFSSGNITEKMRIAQFDCSGKIVVDMFAGIGYFTLPYLVHAKSDRVYAIEWNEDAIEALKSNLVLNHVDDKCEVIVGDNTEVCPVDIADHVNLGLIPSSEKSWPAGVLALSQERGGILHIHGNVDVPIPNPKNLDDEAVIRRPYAFRRRSKSYTMLWAESVLVAIKELVTETFDKNWLVTIKCVNKVKSYGPCVDHLVVDIECRPARYLNFSNMRKRNDEVELIDLTETDIEDSPATYYVPNRNDEVELIDLTLIE